MSEILGVCPVLSPIIAGILCGRAYETSGRPAYTLLGNGETESESLTYTELDRRARAVAAFLQERYNQRERVLLLYPPGLEFIVALFGCFYAGGIAVPVDPPRVKRLDTRLISVVHDAKPSLVLTIESILSKLCTFVRQDSIHPPSRGWQPLV